MNELIKQRITQLNNGEVPNGYENTDFGIFPCDWVKDKTFGDLFDFYGGLGKSRDELGDEGHAYLHYGDLHRGAFNVVSHEQYEQLPKYDVVLKGTETYLMEDGDVAFLDASEDLEGTSRAVLIDNPDNDPFIAGLHIIYGKSKDESLEKWYKQYITTSESVRKQFQRLAAGFKVYGVNRDTLPRIQVAYPKSTEEQSRIAEILMKWDEAIELYNQQIEKLKQLKSIYLKKMFPKNGERVPEWRFKGFTDAWEQCKLGELGEFKSNGVDKLSKPNEHPVNLLNYMDIYNKRKITSKNCNELMHVTAKSQQIKDNNVVANDVFFTPTSETADDIGHVMVIEETLENTVYSYHLMRFRPFVGKLYKTFPNYGFATNSVRMQMSLLAQGVQRFVLSKGQFESIKVALPKFEEQIKIAVFMGNFDNLITFHQSKVEKIKAQQKVLQKYLLNGIVRV